MEPRQLFGSAFSSGSHESLLLSFSSSYSSFNVWRVCVAQILGATRCVAAAPGVTVARATVPNFSYLAPSSHERRSTLLIYLLFFLSQPKTFAPL
jgi:hypothetical protein